MGAKVGIVAVVVLLWVGGALAAEGPYPVRLHPWVELDSVDDAAIDARLRDPFSPDDPKGGGVTVHTLKERPLDRWADWEDRIGESAVANNCVELKALTDAGYSAFSPFKFMRQQALLNWCRILETLRRARPARVSYLRDFVMSAAAVDTLPVMLNYARHTRGKCAEYIANRDGVPWSAMDKIVEVDVIDETSMRVLTEHPNERFTEGGFVWVGGGWTSVRVMAWGDFNGDGIEDLLMNVGSHAVTWRKHTGDYSVATANLGDLFVVTRDAPGAVLHVLDAERYLAPESRGSEPCADP